MRADLQSRPPARFLSPPARRLAWLALAAALAAGCGGEEPGGAAHDHAAHDHAEAPAAPLSHEELAAAVRSYTVPAVIRQLPDPQDPSQQLVLTHGPIPNYVNDEGYETGMPPMTMPFFPLPEVDLAGLAVGDRVEITIRVDRSATPAIRLTAIERVEAVE